MPIPSSKNACAARYEGDFHRRAIVQAAAFRARHCHLVDLEKLAEEVGGPAESDRREQLRRLEPWTAKFPPEFSWSVEQILDPYLSCAGRVKALRYKRLFNRRTRRLDDRAAGSSRRQNREQWRRCAPTDAPGGQVR